jgi:peptidyl-prolyl cis-trans isomerase A (cyclophilin A)
MKPHTLILAGVATAVAALSTHAENLPDGLYAEMDTNQGKIVIRLEHEKAPLTVANFVGLAEGTRNSNKPKGTKFYDGLIFHRVIPGFMIQGGDPDGTGRGGPGYRFADEFHPELRHDRPGILSMANSGPGTNGSQFFITLGPTPHLDNRHSVFGRVVEGQSVVEAIGNAPRGANDRPNQPQTLRSVKILRIGEKAEAFKGDQAHFEKLQGSTAERAQAAERPRGADQQNRVAEAVEALKKQHPDREMVTTASGLRYIVTTEGRGNKPSRGTQVSAHYTGRLVDGTVFDSSVQRGQPLRFAVGIGRVIPGWDEALTDMRKGEKRILVIPPNLAYGERGAGGTIPPNATLIFEVELVDF